MSAKTVYSCRECGIIHNKWAGKCPDCGAWNSLAEEYETGGGVAVIGGSLTTNVAARAKNTNKKGKGHKIELTDLSAQTQEIPRIKIGIGELDRALGGGLVRGSTILIGGNPGIGKSTLLLQTAGSLANAGNNVFYISGEESVDQIRLRAKRLGLEKTKVKLASSTNISDIIKTIDIKEAPTVVVIDSIQAMFIDEIAAAPGTVSQVRSSANQLTILAKAKNIILIIVSHVTKDGQIAGPKVLEHMVDTVLYFEGERGHQFRILRTVKNRFGAANEIGVFEMNDSGLSQVTNPSELFLSSRIRDISGSAVFAGMEGSRPILVELQALIAPSYMPTPRRAVIGWDLNRLSMVLAVLASRFGLNLSNKEVYLNVAGGLKINEPAADLAVILALISAVKDIPLPSNAAIIGEVSLSGEIRMVSGLDIRLKEAAKLGFKNFIIPKDVEKLKNWPKIKSCLSQGKVHIIAHIRDLAQFF